MTSRIDTLLLLALPASGKSELRRYLASLEPEVALRDFGVGPTVQLDDYPYVHLMREIDDELEAAGMEPVFFPASDRSFIEGREWATLIALLNEDYAALGTAPPIPAEPTAWLFDRIDRSRRAVDLLSPLGDLTEEAVAAIALRLDPRIAGLARRRSTMLAGYEPGASTVLIEFARGGPAGSSLPLAAPHGYKFSLPYLSADILRRAGVLYVWVTPDESRHRNLERARPGPEGAASILHHFVPEDVMHEDYGADDFRWLLETGGGDAIDVSVGDDRYSLPVAVFDNRVDHTSFLRQDPQEWSMKQVKLLHEELKQVFARFS